MARNRRHNDELLVRHHPSAFKHETQLVKLAPGATVRQIVDQCKAGAGGRVLVTVNGEAIPARMFDRVRPKPGTIIEVVAVPGDMNTGKESNARTVLQILTSAGGMFLQTVVHGWAGGLLSAATSIAGYFLWSNLIPLPQSTEPGQSYALSGVKNQLNPYGVVPYVAGRALVIPPLASRPYTSVEGDAQYLHLLFLVCRGDAMIDQIRIGATAIENYADVECHIYTPDQLPESAFKDTVVETSIGEVLTYTAGHTEDDWISRTLEDTAEGISVDFKWESGLYATDKDGKDFEAALSLEIQFRAVGMVKWIQEMNFPVLERTDIFIGGSEALELTQTPVRGILEIWDLETNKAYGGQIAWTGEGAVTRTDETYWETRTPSSVAPDRVHEKLNPSGAVITVTAGKIDRSRFPVIIDLEPGGILGWLAVALTGGLLVPMSEYTVNYDAGTLTYKGGSWPGPGGGSPRYYVDYTVTNASAVASTPRWRVKYQTDDLQDTIDDFDIDSAFSDTCGLVSSLCRDIREVSDSDRKITSELKAATVAALIREQTRLLKVVNEFWIDAEAAEASREFADVNANNDGIGTLLQLVQAFHVFGGPPEDSTIHEINDQCFLVCGVLDATLDAIFHSANMHINTQSSQSAMRKYLNFANALAPIYGAANTDNVVFVFKGTTASTFRRTDYWPVLPTIYEIQIRRTTDTPTDDNTYHTDTTWETMRAVTESRRVGLVDGKLVAVRVKASEHISGTVDNVSCMVQQYLSVWISTEECNGGGAVLASTYTNSVGCHAIYDQVAEGWVTNFVWNDNDHGVRVNGAGNWAAGTDRYWVFWQGWETMPTNNPAWHFLAILLGKWNHRPVQPSYPVWNVGTQTWSRDRIDMAAIAAWAVNCHFNSRAVNYVFDTQVTVYQALQLVACAGRASVALNDGRYSVVYEDADKVPVQMFTPRNSSEFAFTLALPDEVHALKIKFTNQNQRFVDDVRIVYDDIHNLDGAPELQADYLYGGDLFLVLSSDVNTGAGGVVSVFDTYTHTTLSSSLYVVYASPGKLALANSALWETNPNGGGRWRVTYWATKTVASKFEALELPGVTDPDQVWREGRYRLRVAAARPRKYSWNCDWEHIRCQRGDVVLVNHFVPLIGYGYGVRVADVTVDEQTEKITDVLLDDIVVMAGGKQYGMTIRSAAGVITYYPVATVVGENQTLTLQTATSDTIARGDLVAFGEAGSLTRELVITAIKPLDDLAATIEAVDWSPEILDSDLGSIPTYQTNISRPPALTPLPPPTPVIASIESADNVLVQAQDRAVSRILISLEPWAVNAGLFKDPAWIQLEYRRAAVTGGAAEPWTQGGQVRATDKQIAMVGGKDGTSYDIRVRYLTDQFACSSWAAAYDVLCLGKLTPPPNITGASVVKTWPPYLRWYYVWPFPSDFKYFEIRRWYPTGMGDECWDNGEVVACGTFQPDSDANQFHEWTVNNPDGGTVYMIAAIDAAGHMSDVVSLYI